jgi:hypothetical protein
MTTWVATNLKKLSEIALAYPHTFFGQDGKIRRIGGAVVETETETTYLQRHEILIKMNMSERASYLLKYLTAFYNALSPMGRIMFICGLFFAFFILLPAFVAVVLTLASSKTEKMRMGTMFLIYLIAAGIWWFASF